MRWTYRFFFILLILCCANLTAAEDGDENNEVEVEGEQKQLAYFPLTPSLITNLQGLGSYIRCDIDLMIEDEMDLEKIQQYAPVIRHELLLLLGQQNGSELNTSEGREALRQKALQAVVAVVLAETGKNSVHDLYFTAFFVE